VYRTSCQDARSGLCLRAMNEHGWMADKPIRFSRHAAGQMIERGATEADVITAVRSGERVAEALLLMKISHDPEGDALYIR
jgi:hypothetical protein